ncbi:MAG: flagellar basal-body MS-ring/collar protein FliF [Terracidiphilus sp.]
MATATQLDKRAPATPGEPQLTDRIAGVWGGIRVRWAALQPAQRGWALAAGALLALLLGGLLWYGLRTDWRTLYVDMDPDDVRLAGQALAQAQIPFEVGPNGTGLLVPAADLDKARLLTAAKGLKTGRLGFELFDKPNWVGSEFDEQVNFQRALEGQLEHTIDSLSDIESSEVNLVLPHDSLFRDQDRPAKASVVLKLRHRALADGEADAIRNLVASSVDGLTPDHVVLVDADGHLPLGPKTPEQMELSAEQALEDKLVATLEPVTGPGNVRASVALDYDESTTDETQDLYDPNQTVTLSMQRTTQSTGPQKVASGVPGTASNAPNSQALPVYPPQTTPPQTAESESGTYGTSKTVRHIIEGPGKIERLTAAVVVNDRLVQPASKGKPAIWQPRSAQELQNLTVLAQAAVGYDPARGDVVKVEDLAFEDNRLQPPVSLPRQVLNTAENSPLLIKYVFLLIGLLVVVAFGLRPALRAAGSASVPVGRGKGRELTAGQASAAPLAPLKPPEAAELDPERIRMQQIFDQVTNHLKREPTQSSRLLQSWIHSD